MVHICHVTSFKVIFNKAANFNTGDWFNTSFKFAINWWSIFNVILKLIVLKFWWDFIADLCSFCPCILICSISNHNSLYETAFSFREVVERSERFLLKIKTIQLHVRDSSKKPLSPFYWWNSVRVTSMVTSSLIIRRLTEIAQEEVTDQWLSLGARSAQLLYRGLGMRLR